ncbi:tRNA adenosine(34) deaminase TadA [Baaleninema sp.]|uniref:tRNA adenosine(34) deaminase TadA n=1 Tax=Baaleninema sp. TaxID=3101197 RepID=UPI003D08678C
MTIDSKTIDSHWMRLALELAQAAGEAGEIPVGAVVVDDRTNSLLATGENRRERDRDPTAHAEILALREAGRVLDSWHLTQCTLYVTLEPCPMCAGAIVLARLGRLVYGADEPKTGAVRTVVNIPDSPVSNHRLQVFGGVLEAECRQSLQGWFDRARRRSNGKPDRDAG